MKELQHYNERDDTARQQRLELLRHRLTSPDRSRWTDRKYFQSIHEEIAWLEENRTVDYSWRQEGSRLLVRISIPGMGAEVDVPMHQRDGETEQQTVEKYLAIEGVWWASKTDASADTAVRGFIQRTPPLPS